MDAPISETVDLPAASMGTRRFLTVRRYGTRENGLKAYLQAGIHADEAPGFLVMHHLMNRLDQAHARGEIAGEIVLVPAANPIGLSQWRDEELRGRFDYYDNGNFNRGYLDLFPAVAERVAGRLGTDPRENVALIRSAIAETLAGITPDSESGFLKHRLLALSFDADIVLDLHCDAQAVLHLYLGTSLWPDAADLPAQLGAEATLLADDSGVTPFDEACSRLWWKLAERFPEHPIPPACLAATVELRGTADVSHELAAADADNLLLFLQRRGVIRGSVPALPPLRRDATPLSGMAQIKAPAAGVVVFHKTPGQWVEPGDVVAKIIDPLETDAERRCHEVCSSAAGVLFARKSDRFARPGRTLAKVAGRVPLKKPGEDLLTP